MTFTTYQFILWSISMCLLGFGLGGFVATRICRHRLQDIQKHSGRIERIAEEKMALANDLITCRCQSGDCEPLNEFVETLVKNTVQSPPEFSKTVDDNFWDLVEREESQ